MKTTRRNFVTGLMAGPVVPLAVADQGIKAPPVVESDYVRNEAPRRIEYVLFEDNVLTWIDSYHTYAPGAGRTIKCLRSTGLRDISPEQADQLHAIGGTIHFAHAHRASMNRAVAHVRMILPDGSEQWQSVSDWLRVPGRDAADGKRLVRLSALRPAEIEKLAARALEEIDRCGFYTLRATEIFASSPVFHDYLTGIFPHFEELFCTVNLCARFNGAGLEYVSPLDKNSYVEIMLSKTFNHDTGHELLGYYAKVKPENRKLLNVIPRVSCLGDHEADTLGCKTLTPLGQMRIALLKGEQTQDSEPAPASPSEPLDPVVLAQIEAIKNAPSISGMIKAASAAQLEPN